MISRQSLAVAAAVLVGFAASTASAENRTTVQIQTVLASNEGRSFDARLVGLKSELKRLRFRSYNLVSSETRVLHGNGGQSGIELPNGRYLHLTTREHTPSHVRLHILLNEDNRPVVNTYVKLELGSVVLLGGPRDEDGTLVITLGSRPWRDGDDELPVQKKPTNDSASPGSGKELPPLAPKAPAQGVPVGAQSQTSSR
jgi:hypothetical protein